MYEALYKRFEVGKRDSSIDAHGLCMAAIQGLYALLQQQIQRLEEQKAVLSAQTERLRALRSKLEQ